MPSPQPWKSRVKPALKIALTALVLAFVGRHVARTWRDLGGRGRLPGLDSAWVAASAGLYLAGLAAYGAFFRRILAGGPDPPAAYPSMRAYLISHLGKYVPGKAMVVVMRAGLVVPWGSRTSTAVFASLYETLVMMAAGGLVAAAGFGLGAGGGPSAVVPAPFLPGGRFEARLSTLGLGLGLLFLAVTWPPAIRRLFALSTLPLPKVGADAMPRLSYRLLAEGLAWSALGWLLLGLSQVAVIRGLVPGGPAAGDWPSVVASVALATVAGFVVPISPGGLGVREWVLWTALASSMDRDLAVVAALVLRLSWVAAEVASAAALFAIRPQPRTGPTEP